jgi:hypothetical protein
MRKARLWILTGTRKWYYWTGIDVGLNNMKKLVLVTLVLGFSLFLFAQDRASMSAPVIRAMPEGNVSFSAQFSDLASTGEYRLGFGPATGKLNGAKIEVLKNGTPINSQISDFEQGYCSNWWNINKVSLQGVSLSGGTIPNKDEKLTLRVTVPKAELEKVKKVYMLVSRKYGTDVWYIEDGVEMNESYW